MRLYGDGRPGPSGRGSRARGFDLDSKIQLFETVIRGLGGLLSAHLFAVGDLPIPGYEPISSEEAASDEPMELPRIQWPNGFKYDGQLLRLAFDLGQRLLPAFYTNTAIPYPRVNLRHGIPFYTNSPLHRTQDWMGQLPDPREITETCSAGAGSLTLEFTVLSRLSGDPRFEQAAKRAFWAVWQRRSDIGLIGNGIDAERGIWITPHSGIGAGMDSFFEYAFKSHVLLSGHDAPNASAAHRRGVDGWLDPNALHPPLPPELHSSSAFLSAWHQAHAAVKKYLLTDRGSYPYYSNIHRSTGQPFTTWIDSLGAFYPGLLALAGELDEAVEANLVYTALWTRYSAIPERWSIIENEIDSKLGWWPGRPEFIESTYYIYRATKDPWYLYVGEMVLKDIHRRCYTPCGWSGLQDVGTGEKADRMESFFLGETAKYMYLLFDPDHVLNKLDAAYVFSTEGHPLIIPAKKRGPAGARSALSSSDIVVASSDSEIFTDSCPVFTPGPPFSGSATAARPHLFDASRFTNLHNSPDVHGPVETITAKDEATGSNVTTYKAMSNHTIFPWTLPLTVLPQNGTCVAPEAKVFSLVEFPGADSIGSLLASAGSSIFLYHGLGYLVKSLTGLRIKLVRRRGSTVKESSGWRISTVGLTHVAQDEDVFFHAETVRHLSDDAFTVSRRKDVVEILLLADLPERHNATAPQADATPDLPGQESSSSVLNAPSTGSSALFKSLLRVVSSVLEPDIANSPAADGSDDVAPVFSWEATTAVGPGAFPLPPVPDTPLVSSPGYNAKRPADNFPWKRVYLAGHACDGALPETASRGHQVIVMLRGGCNFSEKLDKIPSFSPAHGSLQLVVVVDETQAADEATGNEAEPPRPLLDREQLTPKGIKRLNGVPMVLMRADPGSYDLFGEASAVGLRRRYDISSQGRRVENAIVL